jgi:hypothetical protein
MLVLAAGLVAGLPACSPSPPTVVLVTLASDVEPAVPLVIRVTARRGAADVVDAQREQIWARGGDGGIALPASFGVTPGPGDPRDDRVTVLVEGDAAGQVIRRVVRFRFVPQQTLALPVFLSTRCLAADTGCAATPAGPCTRQRACEERGETCGGAGECVPLDVTPVPADRPPPDVAPPCGAADAMCCATEPQCAPRLECSAGACQCHRIQASCAPPPSPNVCCDPEAVCDQWASDRLFHCCFERGQPCGVDDDCCGVLICVSGRCGT